MENEKELNTAKTETVKKLTPAAERKIFLKKLDEEIKAHQEYLLKAFGNDFFAPMVKAMVEDIRYLKTIKKVLSDEV